MAYHGLAMLREAYATNGTPRPDRVLMGLARSDELTPHGYPLTALGWQAEAWTIAADDRDALNPDPPFSLSG